MSSPPITTEDTSSFGSRARAYSDAHALVYNNNRNSPPNINVATGDTDRTNVKYNAAAHHSPTNKMSCSKKRHSYEHHHHHHHHGNRPRSKSLDLHRHRGTASVHKKKYPHHARMIHSPGGHLVHGRISPTTATYSPKLTGKCWVRKAATTSPVPFFPSALCLSGATSRSPTSPNKEDYHQQHQYVDNVTMNNDASSPVRQVTNESSLRSPTSLDDEMMFMHDADDTLSSIMMYTSPNSSFDHHQGPQEEQQKQQGPYQGIIKPAAKRSIIFGESGKPIKPRSSFEQYTSSATATVL